MNNLDTIQTATDPYTEAAEWLERLSGGPLERAEKRRLQQWLQGGDGHRELFERMLATWGDPALAAAAEQIGQPGTASAQRRSRAMGIAAVAACLLCALLWVALGTGPAPAEPIAYQSAIAEEKSVALEDGSELSLEADSALDVQYRADARRIRLHRGAAYFSVARDRQRPFTVISGDTSVRALGTEFSVDRIGGGIDVRVHEGTVRVSRPAMPRPQILTAGQHLRLDDSGRIQLRDFTPSGRGAWHSGWIDIGDESLQYLLGHLSRYSAQPIRLRDPALASLRVAGRFHLRDTRATLGLLSELYPLQVSHRDGRIVISAQQH